MIFQLDEVCKTLGIEKEEYFPESAESFFQYEIVEGDFWGLRKDENQENGGAGELYFKNIVKVMNYPDVVRELPALSSIKWKDLESIPYFVSGLEHIREALSEGRRIGMEGGPCLFGAWEVFMELTLRDGTVKVYDFNLDYLVEDGEYIETEPLLMEAMQLYADDIVEIHFLDKKDGLTGQEIAGVLYLFEAAAALDAQMILSVPDFSYVKYLEALLAYLEPDEEKAGSAEKQKRSEEVRMLQEQCMAEFRTVAYRIADLYLELAEYLKGLYPDVHCQPVHERRADLCEIYYEKRAPYIERNKILRSIRSSEERYESLKDYISLSALPYYLFGCTDILHVCNLDEVDSYQKCRKAHKGVVDLACLLYPEYVAGDGRNIVFYAKKEYKDYYPDFRDYFKENHRS